MMESPILVKHNWQILYVVLTTQGKVQNWNENISRGTTDPGYWLYSIKERLPKKTRKKSGLLPNPPTDPPVFFGHFGPKCHKS